MVLNNISCGMTGKKMLSLLFIDMLGAKQRWQTGGISNSRAAFTQFKALIMTAVRRTDAGVVITGGIETDSAMIVCRSALEALSLANDIYISAFLRKHSGQKPLLWLRGCVIPIDENSFLRKEMRMNRPYGGISVTGYSEEALTAISVEKSGFKGMRLLVHPNLADNATSMLTVSIANQSLYKIHRSRFLKAAGTYSDFLWMACSDDLTWNKYHIEMATRLRLSAQNPEEFAQAAATQVLFHEVGALRASLQSREKRKNETF